MPDPEYTIVEVDYNDVLINLIFKLKTIRFESNRRRN